MWYYTWKQTRVARASNVDHKLTKRAQAEMLRRQQRLVANRTKNSSSLVAFARYMSKLVQKGFADLVLLTSYPAKPDVTLLQKIDPEVLEMITKAEQVQLSAG
eukprot:gene2924-3778_t